MMSNQDMNTQDVGPSQPDFPLKEALTLVGTVVLFIGSIFALIVFIGGVLLPLWLQVLRDLANIVFTIVVLIRALILEESYRLYGYVNKQGLGWLLFGVLLVGGVICVIGSFYSENFIATHSLLLFVVLAFWLTSDIRN